MIKVKTIEDFITFLEVAKSKKVEYQLLASENTAFYGFTSANAKDLPNHFVFSYVLLCPLFNVYISENVKLSEKERVKEVVEGLDFIVFKKIRIADGTIECSK